MIFIDGTWKGGREIHEGDRVCVIAYGYGARQADVGRTGKVVGFNRTRVVVEHDKVHYGDEAVRTYRGCELRVETSEEN